MKASEALKEAKGYATAYRIAFDKAGHALERMQERGAGYEDVRSVLMSGRSARKGNQEERWVILGKDLDGDDLEVVVIFEDGVVVITVF